MSRARPRILAISSGGGHWVELIRLRKAFEGAEAIYATVQREYREDVGDARFFIFNDATRWSKVKLMIMALRVLLIILRTRPDVIITTGAAPGYIAIRIGRMLGARTIWLDSIANADELSMSGQMAGKHVDLWLTQWPHLASDGGPECAGGVL